MYNSLIFNLKIKINIHFLNKYLNFINKRISRINSTDKNQFHLHHILPKAKDMFPEYENLKNNPWNGIYLTIREHYIAHRILNRAFPGSSQTLAFYNMSNFLNKNNSKDYEKAKNFHINKIKLRNNNEEIRKKISNSLKGKPKTEEHKNKLKGHIVTEETRNKIRLKNLGYKHTKEAKLKMSISRTGMKKKSLSIDSKINIAKSKTNYKIHVIDKIFDTYLEGSLYFDMSITRFKNIFIRYLDGIPRKKSLEYFNIENTNKLTYRELGFYLSYY